MQLRASGAVFAAALFTLAAAAPAAMAARDPLNAYRVAPTAENKERLASAGYDMVEGDHGSYLEVYGTAKQAAALKRAGSRAAARRQGQRGRLAGGGRPGRQRRAVQRLAPLRPGADRHQGAVPRAL